MAIGRQPFPASAVDVGRPKAEVEVCSPAGIEARGPYFDELTVGQVFADAPPVTLTDGLQAAHQAIVGNRWLLSLDHRLAQAVAGRSPLSSLGLVWDLSIGQSTAVTQHVKANLFYRGLGFHRFPVIGDTLSTTTTVIGLRQNTPRPDRYPTGLAALHIVTRDQQDRAVLDYWRCAMLSLSSEDVDTGFADDLASIGAARSIHELLQAVSGWDLSALRRERSEPRAGSVISVIGADVVSSAPELARLTGNIARVHHDASADGGGRLVYGGHVIGLALLHVERAFPHLAAVLGWDRCDHLTPVREGESLSTTITIDEVVPVQAGTVLWLTAVVSARGVDEAARRVLEWRLAVLDP